MHGDTLTHTVERSKQYDICRPQLNMEDDTSESLSHSKIQKHFISMNGNEPYYVKILINLKIHARSQINALRTKYS